VKTLRMNIGVVALVLVSTGAFAWGLLIPGEKKLRKQYDQIDTELEQVARLQLEVGSVGDLYASILALDREVSGFRQQLPAERKLGEFLSDLSRCMESSGIVDFSIQPRPVIEVDPERLPDDFKLAKGTAILPVQLNFEGSFANVFQFLDCVESLQRVSHLETMNMDNHESTPGHLTVKLELHVYYHPEG